MKWLVRIALLFIAFIATVLVWGFFQYNQAGRYFTAAMNDIPVNYKKLNEFPPRLLEILNKTELSDFHECKAGTAYAQAYDLIVHRTVGSKRCTPTRSLLQALKLQGQHSVFELFAFQTFGFAYLHNNYSYDDLTEQYLNRGYMGHQYAQPINGYPAAAKFYFRKDLSALSDQEIASLILISRAPALYTKPQNAQRLVEESKMLLEGAKN